MVNQFFGQRKLRPFFRSVRAFGVAGVLLGLLLLEGCNSRRYEVSYPEAVEKLTKAYPLVPEGRDLEYYDVLFKEHPAYSEEFQDTQFFQMPWGIEVTHKETKEGEEYCIEIVKNWELFPCRRTSIIIKSFFGDEVYVMVRSERQVTLGYWTQDAAYESQRLAEIDKIFAPSDKK